MSSSTFSASITPKETNFDYPSVEELTSTRILGNVAAASHRGAKPRLTSAFQSPASPYINLPLESGEDEICKETVELNCDTPTGSGASPLMKTFHQKDESGSWSYVLFPQSNTGSGFFEGDDQQQLGTGAAAICSFDSDVWEQDGSPRSMSSSTCTAIRFRSSQLPLHFAPLERPLSVNWSVPPSDDDTSRAPSP